MRLATIAVLMAVPAVARADGDGSEPLNPLDPIRVVSPLSITQGDGIKVGEGTSLYPQVGVETGYISNVFYSHDNPQGAGILRIIAEAGMGSLSPQRRRPVSSPDSPIDQETETETSDQGSFQYSANAYVAWDQYMFADEPAKNQSGLALGAYLRGIANPGKPANFTVTDSYDRVTRETNFESNHDTNRDINHLSLQLAYTPRGRSLGGALLYSNTIDYFETDEFKISNRMSNTLGARLNWRVLPLTKLYLSVSESYNTGLGSESVKVDSYPLTAVAGINTALTVKTALLARIGYTQGFYSNGPDYATVTGGLYLDYRYGPFGRLRLLYDFEHADSINANFYRDHVFQAWVEHRIDRTSVFISPVVRLRRYEGTVGIGGMAEPVATRDDVIAAVSAGLRFDIRDWIIITGEYRLTMDQTDYRYSTAMTTDPSYIRHEILLGARASY